MSTFAELVAGRESKFPLLARAVADMRPALNPKVEWLLQRDDGLFTDWNYTQIVRARTETELLRETEKILRYGYRYADLKRHTRSCGGCIQLLGREPCDGDVFSLCPLREPSDFHGEVVAEFTLMAIRAGEIPTESLAAA